MKGFPDYLGSEFRQCLQGVERLVYRLRFIFFIRFRVQPVGTVWESLYSASSGYL